jgi:hypothetical protein
VVMTTTTMMMMMMVVMMMAAAVVVQRRHCDGVARWRRAGAYHGACGVGGGGRQGRAVA